MATLKADRLYDCPRCKAKGISPFRFSAHMASKACREYAKMTAAEEALRAVGGYVGYVTDASMVLSTFGKRRVKVLAVAVDDLGHATIVDKNGQVRQYLHGEWEFSDNSAKYLRA